MLDNQQNNQPSLEQRGLLYRFFMFASELFQVVAISLAIIVPVRYFLIQPFYVKGASMEPNFYDAEYLIIDELSYRFSAPVREDTVVFRYPIDPRQYFIKRVIALPGERVKVSGGKVTIFEDPSRTVGVTLDERSYLGDAFTSGEVDVTLGTNEYFLMGDNRGASLDSRVFGPVSQKYIVGRVWIRGWPPGRMRLFRSQATP